MCQNIVNLVNVYKYLGNVCVLSNINLSIKSDQICLVIGGPGSGKTTLINIISVLIKPTKGRVFLFNRRVDDISENRLLGIRKDYLSIILQYNSLIEELSFMDNILLPIMIKYPRDNLRLKSAKDIVLYFLENLSFDTSRIHYRVDSLSWCERRIAEILRAVVKEPEIIIADEPFAGFDTPTKEKLVNILISYTKNLSKILILATSDKKLPKIFDNVYNKRIFNLSNNLLKEEEVREE